MKWFRLAADKNYPDALSILGGFYLDGVGVLIDRKDGFHYSMLASDRGVSIAHFQVGVCYANGWGVEQNTEETVWYLKLAADRGHARAQYHLGKYYAAETEITAARKIESTKYLLLAAEQGFEPAIRTLKNYILG